MIRWLILWIVAVFALVTCGPAKDENFVGREKLPVLEDALERATEQCLRCVRLAGEVPHLDLVEQATREYLLLVENGLKEAGL